MKHVESLLAKLEGVAQTSSGWRACCPCPDHGDGSGDNNPSLAIDLGEDDRILVRCWGGCKTDHVLDCLGLGFQDLWPGSGDLDEEDTAASAKRMNPMKRRQAEAFDADFRHQVYGSLLEKLVLSDAHRANLNERGVNDEEIDQRQYRTLRFLKGKQASWGLAEEFGNQLLTVPGFEMVRGALTTVTLSSGLLIPVRDVGQRIIAFQVRADAATKDRRYLWFSGGDASTGTPAHVPLGVEPGDVVRVTEGPLKADIAFMLSGVPTIAVPGVTTWSSSLPVLKQLKPKVVRLAFDADILTKRSVATSLSEFYHALKEEA